MSLPTPESVLSQTYIDIEPTDVMTGASRRYFLYPQLRMSIQKALRIDIIVSFLMESGVRMLLKDLQGALNRGAKVRILTGNYLGITQPSALYLLKRELKDQVELRFYNEKNRSFHPKAYIFHYEESGEIFIGSSNVSRSAMTSGIEWNYRFNSERDKVNFDKFCDTFEDLFQNHSIILDEQELKNYSKNWHRPAVAKDLKRYDEQQDENTSNVVTLEFQPRGAQIEALYALEESRKEGAVKALVQAATGVGKTYLAAFDSASYEKVLFVAHRDEILKQAAESFENVRKSQDYGFFKGDCKETDKSVIFASVATLGQEKYLADEYFASDYFDYVVIDEFHHAVNKQYMNIVKYFKPKFMLGLTATPERMDGKNIYEICDYNVPYEISLWDAINKGMLVPFHYYGIYDETDYSQLHVVRGRYEEKELNETYIGNVHRHDLIYKYYMKYKSRRALGFCCSRKHAEEMAGEFCRRGIPSVAVYSNADGEFSQERDIAIEKLKNGEIRVIFSVDMFNEGLDIASVDMVMFLRPTESPIVFLQQLGRGLRTFRGKEYLNVLDFIGNYHKAGQAPLLLGKNRRQCGKPAKIQTVDYWDLDYPDDCIIDFDMRLVDLFREMAKKQVKMKDRIKMEYHRVKELLNGKVPAQMELFRHMDDDVYQYCMRNSKQNPFRNYMGFLNEMNELDEAQQQVFGSIGREFLNLVETTAMTKVYKMPIIYSFYNEGKVRMQVSDEEVLIAWKKFFDNGTNWKDFDAKSTLEKYRAMTDTEHLKKAKDMPIHFLCESGQGFFVEKEGCAIALREELREIVDNPAFGAMLKDILEYRTMEYYRRRYMER